MAAGLTGTAVLVAFFHFWTFAQTGQRYVSGWASDRAWTDVFANPSWQPPGGTPTQDARKSRRRATRL